MCLLLFLTSVYLIIVISTGQNLTKYGGDDSNHNMPPEINRLNMITPNHNQTYIDKAENMIRMPLLTTFEDHKNKHNMKKPTKRIIQKIIKKNRNKPRKFYVYHVTSRPTMQPMVDADKMYAQEEQSQWKDDSPTTQSHQRKKSRKWNSKLPRYPMPFQKLQFKKDSSRITHRNKRQVRDDVYILKDLDEMEFLSNKDGYDVVNAHVKNYW